VIWTATRTAPRHNMQGPSLYGKGLGHLHAHSKTRERYFSSTRPSSCTKSQSSICRYLWKDESGQVFWAGLWIDSHLRRGNKLGVSKSQILTNERSPWCHIQGVSINTQYLWFAIGLITS
jgi:hypothetical protein